MEVETEVHGIPVRVVELTGEPGDMVFCHPTIVHCVSPNRGAQPRLMRIRQQLMTHEGQDLLSRSMHPR
jgi:ectoine hydroxylase-related dioxygenase (phytanoyl-CoA dioxygenase family)